jgi:chromate transporter
MSYGEPAIMGIMQAQIQEKRLWISKQDFVEGLALVNMLPGPGATQLGIFIGHAKAGLIGGILTTGSVSEVQQKSLGLMVMVCG